MIEQYQTLYKTICEENNMENSQGFNEEMFNEDCIERFREALISNIRGALIILDQNNIKSENLEGIRNNVTSFVDNFNFNVDKCIDDLMMLEVQRLAENIISKPYQNWMYKEKTRIRHNFAEDAKRTWNRVTQPAGQATKIT
jgi:hypothetical protein